MRDDCRKMRRFLMDTQGLFEDESVGIDFGITHAIDGNWGVHAILEKSLFAGAARAQASVRDGRRNHGARCGCLVACVGARRLCFTDGRSMFLP
jgi:hypothetical protein